MIKLIAGLTLLIGMLAGYVASISQGPILGSIVTGEAYTATSTKNHLGTTIADLSVLKVGSGILGSVIITGANAGTFILYDATTTNANLRTKAATTTIATFPTNLAAGTYVFDITFNDGLILDYVTGMATGTITWK